MYSISFRPPCVNPRVLPSLGRCHIAGKGHQKPESSTRAAGQSEPRRTRNDSTRLRLSWNEWRHGNIARFGAETWRMHARRSYEGVTRGGL